MELPFITLGLLGRRGIVVGCVCLSVRLSVRLSVCKGFVRAITRDTFDLGLSNLVYRFTLG